MAVGNTLWSTRASRWITSTALVLACCIQLPAQQPKPSPNQVLRVSARLVLLDVVVTDKDGHPVTGLTKEDFAIFEDKQPQRIASFEPPSSHQLPTLQNAVFNPTDTRSFGQSPVTILVLDELNTHFADADFARRSIRQFLASQPAKLAQPTTLLVVSNSRFQFIQDFTRDRDTLLDSLARHSAQYPWKLEQSKSIGQGTVERLDQSISALEQIAQSVARIPGRKNLVWVGQGFPSLDPDSLTPALSALLTNTLQHVTDTFLATRITLYAVDPASTAPGLTEITDQTQLEFSQLAGESAGRNIDPFNAELDFDRLHVASGLEWHDADWQSPHPSDAHDSSTSTETARQKLNIHGTPPPTLQTGEHVAQVQVLIVSLSAKNKILAHTLHTMTATARSTADLRSPTLLTDFATTAETPRGTVRLRCVVRDTTTGQMGTADLPIH